MGRKGECGLESSNMGLEEPVFLWLMGKGALGLRASTGLWVSS